MILAVLPLFFWIFVYLILKKGGLCWRESFLYASVLWGATLTAATEALSAFHIFTFVWLAAFWGLLAVMSFIAYYYSPRDGAEDIEVPKIPLSLYALIGGTVMVVFLTGFVASIATPNTPDSMAYHLARVEHWIQNQSVAHYQTNIWTQLIMPPMAEFAVAHFQILNGGDHFANFVQWFSMVGSLIGVSLIAKELNADLRGQVFSSVFCVTIPMGILQSTTTQNDYVAAFWLVSFAYFGIRIKSRANISDALAAGTSLGLALLTKGTSYIYAFPIVIWLLLYPLKHAHRLWKSAVVIGMIALMFNAGHYTRNLKLFGYPLSTKSAFNLANDTFDMSVFASNLIRNFAVLAGTSNEHINTSIESLVRRLHKDINLDINDKRTTLREAQFHFRLITSQSENAASSLFHLILILLAIAIVLSNRRVRNTRNLVPLSLALAAGFLLFCIYLKWQPFHSRLFLPLTVLWSPIVGHVFSQLKIRRVADVCAVLLLSMSVLVCLTNSSKPLIGPDSILPISRLDQRFRIWPKLEEPFMKTASGLQESSCRDIGLVTQTNSWEYLLWTVLREKNNKTFRIEHMGVNDNVSNRLTPKDFNPCAIVKIDKDRKPSFYMLAWEGRYKDGWTGDSATLRLSTPSGLPVGDPGRLVVSIPSNTKILSIIAPVDVEITGSNGRVQTITLDGKHLSGEVECGEFIGGADGKITISVKKNWRPIDRGLSGDTRTLGIQAFYNPR